MRPLQVGTVVLRKYRIDRFRLEGGGLGLYDATDTAHARAVSVKVSTSAGERPRFERELRRADVIDVGKIAGHVCCVASDSPCVSLVRRSKPPPLPARAKPPAAPPLEIPVWVELPHVETHDDEQPRFRTTLRRFWVVAFAAVVALACAGWYAQARTQPLEQATVTRTATPPPLPLPPVLAPALRSPPTATVARPAAYAAPSGSVATAPTLAPEPRKAPSSEDEDPLTL